MTTLRVLLHLAAQLDYELPSLDFSTAFLQGSLHEEIWLRRPPGFTRSFLAGTQWSLRRPVYGLRQAPCEWHDTLRTTRAALEFAPSTADPSLFLRTETLLPPFYVLVNVDDLVFATADTEALALVKSELQKRHTCTDLGELRSYLGLQITRNRARRTITLTQSHMVHQVLQCFGFRYSLPLSNPLPTGHSLSAPPSDESVEPSGPLRSTPGGAETKGAGSGGAEPGGAEPGGAEPAGVEHDGVELGGAESEGAESGGAESRGAEPRGAASSGGPAGASPSGFGATGDTGAGGAGVSAGAGGTGAAGTGGVGGAGAGDPTEHRAAGAGGTGAGGTGAGGAGAGGAGGVDLGAGGAGGTGAGGTVRPRPYFVPLLQQVLGVPSSPSLTPPLLCPPPDQSQPPLPPASPLPAPSPYTEQSGGLTERPMASLRVLAFDHEGRPVQFDTWLDDLQLYLLSDSKDSVSLFDLASGAGTAPPATADSSTRSQWLT
ncbi:unnamed protein product, partial [Closterium sp. NIES-54]